MYGPVPAEWLRSHASPRSEPDWCAIASSGSTIAPTVNVSTERKACGLEVFGRLTTTVSLPTAMVSPSFMPPMSLNKNAGDLLSAITRSKEKATAFAVTGLPVLNLTPGRS